MPAPHPAPRLAVIGGGPAGLMAAETARAAGVEVHLFEAKGSVGRKFLIAGKGGLNLTHGEPRPGFDARYRERAAAVGRWLDGFDPDALRAWARGLGVDTYVGSSGRVFPQDRKAAPLLRAWVRRLKEAGVQLHVHHRWRGWDAAGALRFDTPDGEAAFAADAVVLALGGGSWPQLGSDGAWVEPLRAHGVDIVPLQPANCGFDIGWSALLAGKFAGAPLKPVVAHWQDAAGRAHALQGECVLTATGIEGSLVYAIGADLREAIARDGSAALQLDLAPGRDLARLEADLAKPRKGRSLGEHLRRRAGRAAAPAAAGRGHLDRRRRAAGGAGRGADAAPRPATVTGRPAAGGNLLRRRDAGLGGADRRLPAHRLLRQRPARGARRGALAAAPALAISAPSPCPRRRPWRARPRPAGIPPPAAGRAAPSSAGPG